MVSTKIIYRTDKTNASGEHPVYIRIIKDRRPKYISLNIYLKPEQWDEENRQVKKHPNAQRLNKYISTKFLEAQGVALDMVTAEKQILPEQIKEQIMGKAPESFLKYAKGYLNELDNANKISSYRKNKAIIGKIEEFTGGNDLLFDHITVSWLKAYEQHLKTKYGNKTNTIHSNFRCIRRIINAAIFEDSIKEDKNPFKRFKLTYEQVKKNYLTDEELMLVELAPLQKNSLKDHHRNMFVFSAYAGGLRISDILLLKWKHFETDRIVMQTKKTSSVVSIKLPDKALDILKIYQGPNVKPFDFIFPILKNDIDYTSPKKLYNAISSATAFTNDDLKDIAKIIGLEKHISFHSARHTFATRALMKGMRIEYVSKLMGHSSIQVTQIYAKIVSTELDKAMEVFN